MILKSLTFWTLVAGLLAFVVKFFMPTFPLDATGILALVLFLLGLFGVVPAVRSAIGAGSILTSLAFWEMVVGLIAFVVHQFMPSFPLDTAALLGIILFILGLFGIKPELRARGLI